MSLSTVFQYRSPPQRYEVSLGDADDNTLRIMLTTDNHLGFAEKDPVRGMDSFAAFEEVLYLAKHRFNCDMVLIAGDLFHENRPSRRTLHKTMEIIRRYCLGPGAVKIQILSDPVKNFGNVFGTVNYKDPNYSVDLPIFSIHGNHDDPSRDEGGEMLAALDLLAVSNLVNYWGRQEAVDKVEVSPVLLQKGYTHVALYGLGSMRDERLNRMWRSQKVRFLRPEEDDTEGDDGFFNIFALHQNRDLGRGSKNCVQESMIPEWMDLVVWGHEHECLIEFFESVVGTFRITQPGSSVATSLVSGEAVRKKVGILDIKGKDFRLHTVPLTQVRSFVTTELSLRQHRAALDPDDPKVDERVSKVLEEEVRLMVLHAREKMQQVLEEARNAGNDAGEKDSPLKYKLEKPQEVLVRIRVDHSGFCVLNNQRFGAHFVGDVANLNDVLLFHRKKEQKPTSQTSKRAMMPIAPEELEQTNIEDLVNEHLQAPEQRLKIYEHKILSDALEEFVEKSATSSIPDATATILKTKQKKLISGAKSEGETKVQRAADVRDLINEESEIRTSSQEGRRTQRSQPKNSSRNDQISPEDEDETLSEKRTSNSRVASKTNQKQSPRPNSARAGSRKKKNSEETQRKPSRQRTLVNFDDDSENDEIAVEGEAALMTKALSKSQRVTRGRKVNYGLENDDDDLEDDSEALVVQDDSGDDSLEFEEEETQRKSKRKPVSRTPARNSKAKSERKTLNMRAGKARKRKIYEDSDDDDDDHYIGSALRRSNETDDDPGDDWGTAATRTQH